jgi:hypothetical protein
MTTLSDAQKQAVRAWLQEGLPLAEIQKRLAAELGVHLTYMELKLAVSELDVLPKDQEPAVVPELPKTPAANAHANARAGAPGKAAAPPAAAAPAAPPPAPGKVSVTVDQLTRPGALVSGQVQFSDGKKAAWYLDEMGRLGMVAPEPGYRPPAADIPAFQAALERELSRLGL